MPDRRVKKSRTGAKRTAMKVKEWIKGFINFLNKDSILESEIERRKNVEDFNTRFAIRDRRRNNR